MIICKGNMIKGGRLTFLKGVSIWRLIYRIIGALLCMHCNGFTFRSAIEDTYYSFICDLTNMEQNWTIFIHVHCNWGRHLAVENALEMASSSKEKIVSSLLANEYVLFYYDVLQRNSLRSFWNKLQNSGQLHVAFHLLSHAYTQIYKKTKKIRQRSKALRKNLYSDKASSLYECI